LTHVLNVLPPIRLLALALVAVVVAAPAPARAQNSPASGPAAPAPPLQTAVSAPASIIEPCSVLANETSTNLPPAGSAPLYRCAQLMFHPAGDRVTETAPMIEAQTYAFYLKAQPSARSQNRWVPYDEQALRSDFWNLWRTNFLEDLWIEVVDEPYENGVIGKHVVFHMEERPRVKVVDYVSAQEGQDMQVDISKIETTLRENNIELRLDSMLDESEVRKVIGVIRELHAQLGYNDAVITTERAELPGGPKLLHLTFKIDHGPKVEIAEVVFEGNEAFSDGALRKQLKQNKPKNPWLLFFSDATYKQQAFAEDASRLTEFYGNEGYARAQIGQPQVEVVRTSPDAGRRWIRLRVPIDEGQKYTVGKFELTGDKTLNLDAVRRLFEITEGETFSNEKIRKGLERAKDVYGSYGFWEWSYDVSMEERGIDPVTRRPTTGDEPPPPVMDISLKMIEGKQFYVNRITFTGNTTTHDSVIRRELRVAEGGVFNATALKESVRRINQLGYFKPIEPRPGQPDETAEVTRVPGTDDKVDVKLKVEEQNRNQLAFGAGVSQFDGFFGQLSFQTSNFLGRGETVGISLQRGSQARQYQVSFSEPYLFDRPITVGTDLYSREYNFPYQYTQVADGGNVVFGFSVADYARMFLTYSLERVSIKDLNPIYDDPRVLNGNPFLADSLLLNQPGRRRTVSKISPSIIYNTVNMPIFPSAGTRYTFGVDIAGLGGNTDYIQTRAEGIWYLPLSRRTSLGLRAEGEYIRPYRTTTLPIFEKLFSGGEYSVRGYDLRAISPRDPRTGILVGGNKTLLFNAEYYFNIFSQVRLVAFFDAGQVRDTGQKFQWREPVYQLISPPLPPINDSFGDSPFRLTELGAIRTETVGQRAAFKTSTGFEVRFMMPVLNIPFRLIGAYNPSRGGVLDNQLEPAKKFTFRFAVGTTF
jgi:outer membrane protein insertion porin family